MTSPLRTAPATLTLLVLAACGGSVEDACSAYLRAADECAAEALGLTEQQQRSDADIADSCASYEGLAGDEKRAATDRFDCALAAFDGCDPAGYDAAVTEADACLYE